MHNEKPIEINNLSEYINLLQNYPSSECIFRGENDKYDKRQASAFRKSGCFMYSIKEYYSLIGHRLSEIEKQNFLAFAQHHGLPTNLLDVTSNPLNALFFACNESKENGYVYIFSNWFLVDITEIIEEFPRQSVFDLFVAGNITVVNKISELISELFENKRSLLQFTGTAFIMPGNQFVTHLFCGAYCLARDVYTKKNKIEIDNITYDELLTNVCGDGVVRSNELFFNGFHKAVDSERERFQKLLNLICEDDIMNDMDVNSITQDDLVYYIIFILYCFRVSRKLGKEINSDEYTELFPIMIYKPKITFERARLQQGYFIYTPYVAASGVFSDTEVEMSNILHAQSIKINTPSQVLLELENIGINIGTIYGDYDNIAKYIKDKEARKYVGGKGNG